MTSTHGARWAGLRFAKVIEDAINAAAVGAEIEWDFAPATMGTGDGVAVGYVLVVSCRSMILVPPRIAMAATIWDSSPTDATITAEVTATVERLYQVRSSLARGAFPELPRPGLN